MKNILNIIWNYFGIKSSWCVRLVNEVDMKIIGFFLKVEYIKYTNYYVSLLINLQKLFQAIVSLIIFVIFYKFNIIIFTEYTMNLIMIYLSIFFIIFILRLFYLLIYGYYLLNYTDEDGELFLEGIMSLIQLINFLINVKILYWLLTGLTLNVFIQCNLILVMDLFMVWMFLIYKNFFDYEINGTGVGTFLSYPWLIIIVSVILILFKIDVEDYLPVFIKNYAFLIVGEKNLK